MNNKILGSGFEKRVCELLARDGWWVHFLRPSTSGAQPFDIIAAQDNTPIAIDCKTSIKPIFPFSRLENNQVLAFEKWMRCGNRSPYLFVEYAGDVYSIEYTRLKAELRIDLRRETPIYAESEGR